MKARTPTQHGGQSTVMTLPLPREEAQAREAATEGALEFQEGLFDLEEVYKRGLRGFVKWAAANCQHENQEQWERTTEEPYPGETYREGWDACLRALDGLLTVFLEEYT